MVRKDYQFNEDTYCGYIIKGNLAGAIRYVKQFLTRTRFISDT